MLTMILFAVVFAALAYVTPAETNRTGRIVFIVLAVLCLFAAFAGYAGVVVVR